MNTPHEDLRAMLRVRQYLQEAQDWAEESGVAGPDPAGFDTADPTAPASVSSRKARSLWISRVSALAIGGSPKTEAINYIIAAASQMYPRGWD
jgi:hypothetical protein